MQLLAAFSHLWPPIIFGLESRVAGHFSLEDLHEAPRADPLPDKNPSPARAIPSGGTTGRAKLIVDRTPWGYFPDEGISFLTCAKWDGTKLGRVLVYSPLYHNVGQTLTHLGLMGGKTVVLMDKFDARRVSETIRLQAIEFFFAVPTHMKRLLELE